MIEALDLNKNKFLFKEDFIHLIDVTGYEFEMNLGIKTPVPIPLISNTGLVQLNPNQVNQMQLNNNQIISGSKNPSVMTFKKQDFEVENAANINLTVDKPPESQILPAIKTPSKEGTPNKTPQKKVTVKEADTQLKRVSSKKMPIGKTKTFEEIDDMISDHAKVIDERRKCSPITYLRDPTPKVTLEKQTFGGMPGMGRMFNKEEELVGTQSGVNMFKNDEELVGTQAGVNLEEMQPDNRNAVRNKKEKSEYEDDLNTIVDKFDNSKMALGDCYDQIEYNITGDISTLELSRLMEKCYSKTKKKDISILIKAITPLKEKKIDYNILIQLLMDHSFKKNVL